MDLASPILHRPPPAVHRHRPPSPNHHRRWISRSLHHPPLCGGRHSPIIRRSPHRHHLFSRAPDMVGFDSGESSYEDALSRLSSLITRRTRAEAANNGDCFDHMLDYLKMLELEEPVARLRVIHVAGTKGKGSTCTFTESILRCCGFRTALFTSPHLVDVRERFRIDGVEISKEKFLEYFWWCWNRLQEKTDDNVPMPSYFRFLALLGFKIFSEEQVDVAILEVGLGGRFDATNVVQAPIVCGISSLGYDHMEILGFTLGEIAKEKAGIFKKGVPVYTVPQPQEAMAVLETQASQLGIPLHVALPLDMGLLKTQKLGLDGEHQYINAGLAVALCQTWLKKTGNTEVYIDDNAVLPEQFVKGLMMAHLQGRAQVVHDPHVRMHNINFGLGGLVYYLDGAHSPESLEVCARWFSHLVKKDTQQSDHLEELHQDCQNARQAGEANNHQNIVQILLFNCMSVRDPQLLLPRLINTCGSHGVHFHKAIFVPNQSVFNKVRSHASLPTNDPQLIDLSWQLSLQRLYENLRGESGVDNDKIMDPHESRKFADNSNTKSYASSSVFPSLPLAIKWLRDTVEQNRSIHFQVLVTGSMHLVGDVLRLIKK